MRIYYIHCAVAFCFPFPLAVAHATRCCSLGLAATTVFAVKQQGWKIGVMGDPRAGCRAVCLFTGVIGNVRVAAEGLPCAETRRHHRATQILQAIPFGKARVRGERVEVLSSCPANRDYPGVSFSEAPVFTGMEILQCKESKAISLHSN